METIFNIIRNVFAVLGLVLSIALVIVLCNDEHAGQFWAAPGQTTDLLFEDLDYFFQAFEHTHPDPYSTFGGERRFHREVKKLRRSISRVEGLDASHLQTPWIRLPCRPAVYK